MTTGAPSTPRVRPPAVAGTFYPARPDRLARLVDRAVDIAETMAPPPVATLAGILVPHAGLEYSGIVAAAGWRALLASPDARDRREAPERREAREVGVTTPRTIVILGTNHRAAWLEGLGVWPDGAWSTPLGDVAVDEELADAISGAGPGFGIDRDAHRGEHSIEVQLPFVRVLDPSARIVPVAVATGRGGPAVVAGEALATVLRQAGSGARSVSVAISTDMAHYPPAGPCRRITEMLLPALVALDVELLDALEREIAASGVRDTVCGMCGIEPALVGLAALRAMGAKSGIHLASATSADAGGPDDRTVGYLSVAFPG